MRVSPGEKLTRFIRYSNQFSHVNNVVKYRAFIPPRNSPNLSMFRISFPQQLSESDIWEIGHEHVQGTGNPIMLETASTQCLNIHTELGAIDEQ